ncbi:phage protein Gp37 [Pseudodesulfovibrio senegalensis]|uniref:DUF1834 family protein n=1 Tax=Pseudodesulfovibrio senegalensis TaxID=1721087 RepID=A0A6N6N2D7_9BACT|nr:phage protein Gp37 [Pseudodesulfovibrio senegalensis]KAB1440351.1 DUF1834 family protein [Pseudodesulfovibrio senegalensis]
MSLASLRDAVVAKIDQATSRKVHCASHGGRFDLHELKRISTKAPAVFVAVLGFSDLTESCGDYEAWVTWGAFVVTRDRPGQPRDLAALSIVDMLSLLIPGNTWDLKESISTAERTRADNLFSTVIDKAGMAMWAISWRQNMTLGQAMTESDLASLDPFATLSAKYPLAGDAPEAEDLVNLPQDGE